MANPTIFAFTLFNWKNALYKFGYRLIFKITISHVFFHKAIIQTSWMTPCKILLHCLKHFRDMQLFVKLDRFWLQLFMQFSVSCKICVIQLLSTYEMHSQEGKLHEKILESIILKHLKTSWTIFESSWTILSLRERYRTFLNLLEPSWTYLNLMNILELL